MGQSYLNRQLGSVRTPVNGAILIAGTVATDGSGNVTSVTPTSGYEFSCSRTGTGVYTLTLSDKAKTFLGGAAGSIAATITFAKVSAVDVSGAGTIAFTFYNESAGTMGASNQISTTLHFWVLVSGTNKPTF